MHTHTSGDCGERVVPCRWCDLGCTVRVKQAALPTHEAEASGEHLELAREALLAQQMLTGAFLCCVNVFVRNRAVVYSLRGAQKRLWRGTRSGSNGAQRRAAQPHGAYW
jgi:hypothetical protein